MKKDVGVNVLTAPDKTTCTDGIIGTGEFSLRI